MKMWSVMAGIAAGWAFYYIWRRILPRERSREFWRSVPAHASGMLRSEDPDDVFRHYRALLRHAATFGTRNTLAVLAGVLPLVALFLLADRLHAAERRVPIVELQPAAAVADLPESAAWTPTPDGGLQFDRRSYGDSGLNLLGQTLDREALANKRAYCAGWLSCMGFELMLFETHRLSAHAGSTETGSVVIRPRVFDANPWWPYLDDLELAFFASAAAGGIAAGWLSSRSRVAPA
jgi:hypothetical protein